MAVSMKFFTWISVIQLKYTIQNKYDLHSYLMFEIYDMWWTETDFIIPSMIDKAQHELCLKVILSTILYKNVYTCYFSKA